MSDSSFKEHYQFFERGTHETTRIDGRTMENPRTLYAAFQVHRASPERSSADGRRDVVDRSNRRSMARSARAVRTLANRVRLVQPLEQRWYVGPDSRSLADSPGRRGPDRLGPLVRRRQQYPSQPGSGRGGEKRGPLEPQDHALGRSRGGFGTKLHLVTDGNGLPLAVEITPGQRHESTQFEILMDAVRIPQPIGRPRQRPAAVAGDKGYSYPWIRTWLREHAIRAVIPMRSDQQVYHRGRLPSFDKQQYRRRSVIECCIGWLKECRRVATRFEKLAINFLAIIKVAIIQRYLNLSFSDRA